MELHVTSLISLIGEIACRHFKTITAGRAAGTANGSLLQLIALPTWVPQHAVTVPSGVIPRLPVNESYGCLSQ